MHHDNIQFWAGDGEFHRHWQEVAVDLPPSEWYLVSPFNPGNYCTLDYPIVTAYLHWFMGTFITKPLIPSSLRMTTLWKDMTPIPGQQSRVNVHTTDEYTNNEGVLMYPFQTSRFYMTYKYFFVQRMTFLMLDTFLLGSAILSVGTYLWRRVNPRLRFSATLILLITPLGIVIDHGNPQVNFLSISFFFFAFRFALSQHYALSASIAVVAVFSKVTALSVMIPFGVLVLSRLYHSKYFPDSSNSQKLFYLGKIALSVLFTFLVIHLPIILTQSFKKEHMWHLIFPFSRFLSEQPLPNLVRFIDYYITQTVYIYPHDQRGQRYRQIANLCTLTIAIPGAIALAQKPTIRRFIKAIQLNALGFIHVSYCLHEKASLWFIFPLGLSLFDDNPALYLTACFLTTVSAFSVSLESMNETVLFTMLLLQFIVYAFYSQFPKSQIPQNQSILQFLSRGVNKYLPMVVFALCCYLFYAASDDFYKNQSFKETDRVFSYMTGAFIPLWFYLYHRMTADEESIKDITGFDRELKSKLH